MYFTWTDTKHLLPGTGRGDGDDGPGCWSSTTPVIPHERFVVPGSLIFMRRLPTVTAKILEAHKVPENIYITTSINLADTDLQKYGPCFSKQQEHRESSR